MKNMLKKHTQDLYKDMGTCKRAATRNASPSYGLYFSDHEISCLGVTYSNCYSQSDLKATERSIKFYHHLRKEQT